LKSMDAFEKRNKMIAGLSVTTQAGN